MFVFEKFFEKYAAVKIINFEGKED